MNSHRTFSIALLSIIFISSFAASPDFIVEVFRHGARGPLDQKFDPEKKWGADVGQLTPAGMRMHYLLGVALKEKYPDLLTEYDPETVFARSTDVNRTIMSAYSHLFGVYQDLGPSLRDDMDPFQAIPPYASDKIEEKIKEMENSKALPNKFQVVPVHVATGNKDYLLKAWDACPRASTWLGIDGSDSASKEVFENDMKAIVAHLQEQKLEINNMVDLYLAGDNCVTNKAQGIPLPGSVNPNSEFYKDMQFAYEWFTTKLFADGEEQIALLGANSLNGIYEFLEAAANGTGKLKYASLSAHDATLINILAPLKIVTTDCLLENFRSEKKGEERPHPHCDFPQYASNVIFELYKGEEPYVELKYNGKAVPLCGETEKCTLPVLKEHFSTVTKGYTLEDFIRMCNIPTPKPEEPSYVFWFILLLLVSGLLGFGIRHFYYQLQKNMIALEGQPGQAGYYQKQ